MKKDHSIRIIIAAILLVASMLISSFILASCGSSDDAYHGEVPEELKEENRRKIINDISEEDRAAYIAKLDEYIRYVNGEFSLIEDLYPEDHWENVGMTPEEAIERLKASEAKNVAANTEYYGEGYKATYEIVSEKNYELMLESLKSSIEESSDISPDRISKAYVVDFDLTISGPKNKSTESMYFFPVKIDGKWYLANSTGGFN